MDEVLAWIPAPKADATHVTKEDLTRISAKMHGLGLDWLVFTTALAVRNGKTPGKETMLYLKETFDGMRDVMDDFANEVSG